MNHFVIPIQSKVRFLYSCKRLFYVFLWIFFALLLSGGSFGFGGWIIKSSLDDSHIWKRGKLAVYSLFSGKVTTTNFVFKEYKLKLHYSTQEGKSYHKSVNVHRFFTGPNSKSPYQIKYLEREPHKATISWAADSWVHQWIFASLLFVLGVLFLIFFVIPHEIWIDWRQKIRLMKAGELKWAQLKNYHIKYHTGGDASYVFQYNIPNGSDSLQFTTTITDVKQLPYYSNDQERILVLVSKDCKEHRILPFDLHWMVLDDFTKRSVESSR